MGTLVILIGASGSGKSTLSQRLLKQEPSGVVCSADDGMMEDGVYRFAASKLPRAHMLAQEKARKSLALGVPLVIVDNTNTTIGDLRPFVMLGERARYQIRVRVFPEMDAATLATRNLHGVPVEAILLQQTKIRTLLGQWPASWPPYEFVSFGAQ